MRRMWAAALGALLTSCASPLATDREPQAQLLGPAPLPAYRLIDLSDDYATYFDRTAGLDEAARVAAFNREVAPLFSAFYRPGRPGAPDTQARFDARIARSLKAFPTDRPAYEIAAANFRGGLDDAVVRFEDAFPDAGHLGDIYLVHSLGEMDGGMRDLDGRRYLIFGAEMIARYHPPGQEEPFFSHELFHRYHSRWFSDCEQLWCGVWAEGLAVLAAEHLHPGASDEALLLATPEPLRAPVDADRSAAVCAIVSRLDSTNARDQAAILSAGDGRLSPRLPPRFGYYVGYLAAREAARARPLAELARLSPQDARQTLAAGLAALAACPD